MDDRSMFLTFLRGHCVYEWEIRKLFIFYFGDYVYFVDMEWADCGEEIPFVRVVFHDALTIDILLKGTSKAKCSVNEKNVGM